MPAPPHPKNQASVQSRNSRGCLREGNLLEAAFKPDTKSSSNTLTYGCLIANVLKQNTQSLQELETNKPATLSAEGFQKKLLHILLKKKTREGEENHNIEVSDTESSLKDSGVILVSPYQDLSNGTKCLDQQSLVYLSDDLVSSKYLILVPARDTYSTISIRHSIAIVTRYVASS